MAGDWIKMRADLVGHPKVFRLAAKLKQNEFYAIGALFAFWSWADKHSVDGRIEGATAQFIDRVIKVKGLADGLVLVDWLVIDDTGITIPRYADHNGNTAKDRAMRNQRQARWRDGVASTRPSTEPSTSASTKASTREEKRRVDDEEQRSNHLKAVDNFGAGGPKWWQSDASILSKGKELGLEARPGESMTEFKDRLFVRLKA